VLTTTLIVVAVAGGIAGVTAGVILATSGGQVSPSK